MGFFEKLVAGLGKTRDNIVSGMDSIFHGFSRIDDDFYEELEEVLIMGDLGVQATYDILDDLKAKVKEKHIKEPMECREEYALAGDALKLAPHDEAEGDEKNSGQNIYGTFFHLHPS